MNPKQELEILRKEKRLAELEAKAGASAPTTTAPPQNPETWGDVASQALSNFVPSAKQFGKDMVDPFMHPIDAAKNMYELGKGVSQKLIPGEQASEATADAVGKYLKDRLWGIPNIKRTLANDPVGALGDLSMLITGGGSAVARIPGAVGKIGQAATKAGNIIDPATLAVKGVGKAGHYGGIATKNILGATTGVGADVLHQFYMITVTHEVVPAQVHLRSNTLCVLEEFITDTTN